MNSVPKSGRTEAERNEKRNSKERTKAKNFNIVSTSFFFPLNT
jgi:hypothetical protein